MAKHSDATSIHKGAYYTPDDPGDVGAEKLWIDTSSGPPYLLKVRSSDNTYWDEVGGVGDSSPGFESPLTTPGDIIIMTGASAVPGTNQATVGLGASINANFEDVSFPASLIIDEDDGTEYFSETHAVVDVIVDINLGAPRTIAAFRILQSLATAMTIRSSTDGSAWTDRFTYNTTGSDPVDSGVTELIAPVTAQYWEFQPILPGDGFAGWRVNSIELLTASVPSTLAATRLPIGTEGQVLTVVSGVPAWV